MLERIKRIDTRWIMVGYLLILDLASIYALGAWENLWWILGVVAIYAALDIGWTYFRDRARFLPLSAFVSGLILATVALPLLSLPFMILLPLLAVFSKQLFRERRKLIVVVIVGVVAAALLWLLGAFRAAPNSFAIFVTLLVVLGLLASAWRIRARQVYNPGAYAMAVASAFIPAVSWWGMSFAASAEGGTARLLFLFVVLAGLFISWHVGRLRATLAFLLSYALFLAIMYLRNGFSFATLGGFLVPQILEATIIFFATAMVVEPVTSTFPRLQHQIYYGIFVGFFAVAVTYFGIVFQSPTTDPLIYGLLFGNLLASFLFLRRG